MPTDLLARVEMLERRCAMLEALVNHRDGLSRAVAILVEESTGEFTEPQLRAEIYKRWPALRPPVEHQQVAVKLHRMAQQRQIVIVVKASDPQPNVYARNERPPEDAGQPGRKRGGGGGLYQRVRAALPSLSEKFTADEVRKAIGRRGADGFVEGFDTGLPHCLRELVKAGELTVFLPSKRGQKQIWQRGAVVVSPTGDRLSEKEKAWNEFRNGLNESSSPTAAGGNGGAERNDGKI